MKRNKNNRLLLRRRNKNSVSTAKNYRKIKVNLKNETLNIF